MNLREINDVDCMVKQGERHFNSCFISYVNISDQDLSGIDFSKSTLMGVHFFRCNLTGAKFKNTSLQDTEFMDCTLTEADFSESCIHSRFNRCCLKDVDFSKTSFRKGYLRGCELSGTIMESVLLDGTWISGSFFCKPLKAGYTISYTQGGATRDEMLAQQAVLFHELGIFPNPSHMEAVVSFENDYLLHIAVTDGELDVKMLEPNKDRSFKPVDEWKDNLDSNIQDIPSAVCLVLDAMSPSWSSWGSFSITDLTIDEIEEALK